MLELINYMFDPGYWRYGSFRVKGEVDDIIFKGYSLKVVKGISRRSKPFHLYMETKPALHFSASAAWPPATTQADPEAAPIKFSISDYKI